MLAFAAVGAGCGNTSFSDEEMLVISSSAILIVDVKNVSEERVLEDPWGGFHLAEFELKDVIAADGKARTADLGSIKLPFRQHMSHWVDFQVGHTYLIHITFCWNEPILVDPEMVSRVESSTVRLNLPKARESDIAELKVQYAQYFEEGFEEVRERFQASLCGKSPVYHGVKV